MTGADHPFLLDFSAVSVNDGAGVGVDVEVEVEVGDGVGSGVGDGLYEEYDIRLT